MRPPSLAAAPSSRNPQGVSVAHDNTVQTGSGQDSPLLAPGVWGPAAYDFESVYPGSGLLAFNVAPAFEPSLQTVYMSSVVVETKAEPLVTYSQAPGSEASASQAVFAEEASGSSAIADKLTEPYGVGSGTGGGWVIGQFSNDATASLPGTTEFRAVLTSALAAISPATAPLVWSYVSSAFESIPKSNTPLNGASALAQDNLINAQLANIAGLPANLKTVAGINSAIGSSSTAQAAISTQSNSYFMTSVWNPVQALVNPSMDPTPLFGPFQALFGTPGALQYAAQNNLANYTNQYPNGITLGGPMWNLLHSGSGTWSTSRGNVTVTVTSVASAQQALQGLLQAGLSTQQALNGNSSFRNQAMRQAKDLSAADASAAQYGYAPLPSLSANPQFGIGPTTYTPAGGSGITVSGNNSVDGGTSNAFSGTVNNTNVASFSQTINNANNTSAIESALSNLGYGLTQQNFSLPNGQGTQTSASGDSTPGQTTTINIPGATVYAAPNSIVTDLGSFNSITVGPFANVTALGSIPRVTIDGQGATVQGNNGIFGWGLNFGTSTNASGNNNTYVLPTGLISLNLGPGYGTVTAQPGDTILVAGASPSGTDYNIGGNLSGVIVDQEVASDVYVPGIDVFVPTPNIPTITGGPGTVIVGTPQGGDFLVSNGSGMTTFGATGDGYQDLGVGNNVTDYTSGSSSIIYSSATNQGISVSNGDVYWALNGQPLLGTSTTVNGQNDTLFQEPSSTVTVSGGGNTDFFAQSGDSTNFIGNTTQLATDSGIFSSSDTGTLYYNNTQTQSSEAQQFNPTSSISVVITDYTGLNDSGSKELITDNYDNGQSSTTFYGAFSGDTSATQVTETYSGLYDTGTLLSKDTVLTASGDQVDDIYHYNGSTLTGYTQNAFFSNGTEFSSEGFNGAGALTNVYSGIDFSAYDIFPGGYFYNGYYGFAVSAAKDAASAAGGKGAIYRPFTPGQLGGRPDAVAANAFSQLDGRSAPSSDQFVPASKADIAAANSPYSGLTLPATATLNSSFLDTKVGTTTPDGWAQYVAATALPDPLLAFGPPPFQAPGTSQATIPLAVNWSDKTTVFNLPAGGTQTLSASVTQYWQQVARDIASGIWTSADASAQSTIAKAYGTHPIGSASSGAINGMGTGVWDVLGKSGTWLSTMHEVHPVFAL